MGQVARVEIACGTRGGEGDKLLAEDRIHASSIHIHTYIYIYIYIYGYRIFFLLFFLIRREIGQIKIRSEVRVALEFTRFLVTRGSSCVDEGSYSFFSSFSMENFSHSTFFRKRTVNQE